MSKTVLVLIGSLALSGFAQAEPPGGREKKNKQPPNAQVTTNVQQQTNVGPGRGPQRSGNSSAALSGSGRLPAVQSNANATVDPNNPNRLKIGNRSQFGQSNVPAVQSNAGVENPATQIQPNTNLQARGKKWHAQNFRLQQNTNVTGVKFQGNTRIAGSQNWQGQNYAAFRDYAAQRHDRDWWQQRHNRIVLAGGGYYYWNNGWWYPAWGYDPSSEFYAYDGPIYGYNDLPPDQVIANVQAALQAQGYYQGVVDGLLGPLTRAALAAYQRDRGLTITSAIDQPTLYSLGLT